MKMNRILAVLMAAVLALGLVACGNQSSNKTEAKPITYFSAVYGETMDDNMILSLRPDETEGRFFLEYENGSTFVQGTTDSALASELSQIFAQANLSDLNEKNEIGEGESAASLSVEFEDGTSFSCSYSGAEVPEKLVTALTSMQQATEKVLDTVEPYRATVDFAADVNADSKAAFDAVFAHMSNNALEMVAGINVPAGNQFGFDIALDPNRDDFQTVAEEISSQVANTTVVQNMMSTVAHQLVLFQLNEGVDAAALETSLIDHADWRKWVCVDPELAFTATKDNYVMFGMTLTDIYNDMTAALEAEGWTVNNMVENPNLDF